MKNTAPLICEPANPATCPETCGRVCVSLSFASRRIRDAQAQLTLDLFAPARQLDAGAAE